MLKQQRCKQHLEEMYFLKGKTAEFFTDYFPYLSFFRKLAVQDISRKKIGSTVLGTDFSLTITIIKYLVEIKSLTKKQFMMSA